MIIYTGNIYLFKVNNRNIRKRVNICSELRIKTPKRCHFCCSGALLLTLKILHIFSSSVWIVDFEETNASWALTKLKKYYRTLPLLHRKYSSDFIFLFLKEHMSYIILCSTAFNSSSKYQKCTQYEYKYNYTKYSPRLQLEKQDCLALN